MNLALHSRVLNFVETSLNHESLADHFDVSPDSVQLMKSIVVHANENIIEQVGWKNSSIWMNED